MFGDFIGRFVLIMVGFLFLENVGDGFCFFRIEMWEDLMI